MHRFTPVRLTIARMRRGLRQQELAESCGVDSRTARAWEKGEWPPDDESLQNLARLLRFPAAFFSAPPLELIDPDAASFRSLSTMRAPQRAAVRAAGTLAVPIAQWITSRFKVPKLDVPEYREEDAQPSSDPALDSAELAAIALRSAWGLGEGPAPNMVHLLESRGVRVFSLAEPTREFDAFSFRHDGEAYALLNTMKSAERGRFDAAHELGHLVMHGKGTVHGPAAEAQADRFASAFLMPCAGLASQRLRNVTMQTLLTLKRQWQVSLAAMAYRLEQLGTLSEWQYREIVIEIQRRGWRTSEPYPMPKREASQVFGKIFGALRNADCTPQALAKAVCLPIEEVQHMTFGWTQTEPAQARELPAPPPPGGPRPVLSIVRSVAAPRSSRSALSDPAPVALLPGDDDATTQRGRPLRN